MMNTLAVRVNVAIAVICMIAITPVFAVAEGTQLDPALHAVLSHFTSDEFGDLTAVDAYIQTHPNDGNGYAVRCSLRLAMAKTGDDMKAGAADCTKALQLAPTSTFALTMVGNVLYDNGNLKASLDAYTRAIDGGETGLGVFWRRCDARRRTGDLTGATADCDRQLQLTPNDFHALYAHGVLDDARGDYENALRNLSAALTLHPNEIVALYWRGIAYEGLKRYAEAEADYSRCIALGDRAPDTSYHRGLVRLAMGKNSDAATDFSTAMAQYTAAQQMDQANHMRDLIKKAASATAAPSVSPAPRRV